MNIKKQEIEILDNQIIVSIISVVTVIVSILLTYNQKLYLQKRRPLFTLNTTQKISLINRLIILITLIAFLIYNYQFYDIAKKKNENLTNSILQIIASYSGVIGALIALYVVANSSPGGISEVENPVI